MVGLLGLAATAGLEPVRARDTWVHLTTGRLILEEGAVPRTDRYSFTAAGQRYVAHEWLAQVGYAAAERWGGREGARWAAKAIPALLAGALLWAVLAASGARPGVALPLGTLALLVARGRIAARPELLAWLLMLATLTLLWRDRALRRRGERSRAVYLLIPIAALWANVHGSYPVAVGIALVFAGAELGDRLLGRRDATAARTRAGVLVASVGGALWLAGQAPPAFGLAAAAVLAVFALVLAVDAREPVFRDPTPLPGRGTGRLFALAGAMALAVLANPRGAEIYLFPFEFTAGVNTVTSFVLEWRPFLEVRLGAHGSLAFGAFLFYLATGFGAVALAVARGSLGRLELGLFLALLLLPLRHVRWMALFALATAPALAVTLCGGVEPASSRPSRLRSALALGLGIFAGGLAAAGATVSAGIASDAALAATLVVALACGAVALAAGWKRIEGAGVRFAAAAATGLLVLSVVHGIPNVPRQARRPALLAPEPVGWIGLAAPGVAFLREHEVPGRLFTNYGWASYAIHQLWPRVTVFLDGRSEVYGEALLEEYQAILASDARARDAIARFGIDLVLLPYQPYPGPVEERSGMLAAIESDPDWGLLYVDDGSVLYARRGLERTLPAAFERLAPLRLKPADLQAADPELEAELRRALALAPHSSFLGFALASMLSRRGQSGDALAVAEAAWAANPRQPAAPLLAGRLSAAKGDRVAARLWFERALHAAPGWEPPARRLRELER